MSHVSQKKPFASLVDDDEPHITSPSPPPPIRMSPSDLQFCQNTMKVLKRNKRSVAFQNPVDPVKFNILDYFDVIKHPMDLGTVESKLKQNAYPSIEPFLADIQLIFDNCYLYNNPYDPVTIDAKKLEESFKRQLKKVPSHVNVSHLFQDQEDNHIVHESSMLVEPIRPPSPIAEPMVMEQQAPPLTVKLSLPKPDTLKREREQSPSVMSEEEFKRCEAIVKELKKPKYLSISWPFQQPVDADAWGATDYYDIIKQPMDMTTYEKKLYSGEYTHENQLAEDIRLMFRNCYAYNPPEHEINLYGHQLEQVFEKTWEKLHHTKSKDKKSSKKQRTAEKGAINNSTIHEISTQLPIPQPSQQASPPPLPPVAPVIHMVAPQPPPPPPITNETVNHSINSSTPGRSNILRLKITTKNKEQEPSSNSSTPTGNNNNSNRLKISITPSKQIKAPGLALSKEPPKPIATATAKTPGLALSKEPTRPKLAIGRPPSPKSKAEPVLHNHDKWLALAKNVPTLPLPKLPVHTNRKLTESSISYTQPLQPTPRISPPPPPPKPKEQPKGFDITEIYSQIKNGARLRDQEEREKQEKFEREERIRLENERIEAERRLQRLREFNIHAKQLRTKDKEERMKELDKNPTDISRQKMMFTAFERDMMRDVDWVNILHWQRDTVNYRNIPAPGFIKRSSVKLTDLRAKLLSKCVRLENAMANNISNVNMEEQGDSDMDID
ncbi:Bromodomain-containing protein [Thamnidium elegans]|nr:Bromodomain-containing protein [Thamnidium elegans]